MGPPQQRTPLPMSARPDRPVAAERPPVVRCPSRRSSIVPIAISRVLPRPMLVGERYGQLRHDPLHSGRAAAALACAGRSVNEMGVYRAPASVWWISPVRSVMRLMPVRVRGLEPGRQRASCGGAPR